MKSKTSFFNKGIFNNLVKRFWPAWALYAATMLLSMPISFMSDIRYSANKTVSFMNHMNTVSGEVTAVMAFVFAIITATGLFSFMYRQRETSMIASLPVKREAVFVSTYLAGLLPLTAINAITAILTLLTAAGHLNAECIKAVLIWFGSYTLEFIAFYGIACVIAVLTGSIVALPVLYMILNFLAIAIEGLIRSIIQIFVYGYLFSENLVARILSPVVYIIDKAGVELKYPEGFFDAVSDKMCPQISFSGWGVIAAYAAVGIVLSAVAMLLYRRRRMECTGDVIAIPVLRPVFKYGVSVCASISFGLLLYFMLWENIGISTQSTGTFVGIFIGMAIGAALGYFGSEMLLKKSAHVFKNNFSGFAAVLAFALILCLACRLDVFGLGRYVPEARDVKSASISGSYEEMIFKDSENIKEITSIHKNITENLSDTAKAENEINKTGDFENSMPLHIEYTLKNGRKLIRSYLLRNDSPEAREYAEFMKSEKVLDLRCTQFASFGVENVENASLSYCLNNEEWLSCDLNSAQAISLYKDGIEPDIKAGNISFVSTYSDETAPVVWMEFSDSDNNFSNLSCEINADCTHTVQWFKDNFGVDICGVIKAPMVNPEIENAG